MGGDLASLSTTPVQILRAHDSKASKKSVEAVAKYMEEERMLQRLVEISTEVTPDEDEEKIEAIDRDILRAMACTINKIRKIYTSL
jgi:hypothetical protein